MACSSGFGNLIDGQHPIWIADFTGAGHAQIMFYYAGDGNWWLGDMVAGKLQWSLTGNTGKVFSKCFGINVILVGIESFTTADLRKVNDSLDAMKKIFSKVDLGIRSIEWWQISNAEAGSKAVIDNESEASDLTSDWSVPNSSLDLFVVRNMNGADGWSAVNGSCNKDAKGMNGSVVSLNGNVSNSGNTFAHETAHYLGLEHIADAGNFIGNNGASNGNTEIYTWQGDTIKKHCFVS
jgi:hypothetical protein